MTKPNEDEKQVESPKPKIEEEKAMTHEEALNKVCAMEFWQYRFVQAISCIADKASPDGDHYQQTINALERIHYMSKDWLIELNPLWAEPTTGTAMKQVESHKPEFTQEEEIVLSQLMVKMDLSRHAVLRQGLRLVQLIQAGHMKLVETNPVLKLAVESPKPERCPECDEAARHAYSDATTPGFFSLKCAKHREVESPKPAATKWLLANAVEMEEYCGPEMKIRLKGEFANASLAKIVEAYAEHSLAAARQELALAKSCVEHMVETERLAFSELAYKGLDGVSLPELARSAMTELRAARQELEGLKLVLAVQQHGNHELETAHLELRAAREREKRLRDEIREFLTHDGGEGSKDYDASKYRGSREKLRAESVLGDKKEPEPIKAPAPPLKNS